MPHALLLREPGPSPTPMAGIADGKGAEAALQGTEREEKSPSPTEGAAAGPSSTTRALFPESDPVPRTRGPVELPDSDSDLDESERPVRCRWDALRRDLVRASGLGAEKALARGTTGQILGTNFCTMLSEIESINGHLLGPDETSFLTHFRALASSEQCLFVRLWQRKGPWVRVSGIGPYPEVPDTAASLGELGRVGLLAEMPREPLDRAGDMYSVRYSAVAL